MKVLIVESPSKAKTIQEYLGNSYTVLSSYGHIRSIPSKSGSVNYEDFVPKYETIKTSEKAVQQISKAIKKASEIYLATDPDREGEAISFHILEYLNEKNALPKSCVIKRVVFHEIVKKKIIEAISNPRDINYNLVQAQQARQTLDYLFGFTLSPMIWRKLPGSKSAGRVQSVALRMICEREKEIIEFNRQEYWSILCKLSQFNTAKYFFGDLIRYNKEKLEKFSITNKKYAEEISTTIQSFEFLVSKVEKTSSLRSPYPPFTTSSLMQDASRKIGFSAKKTALISQKLYEGVKIDNQLTGLITYIRTDSVHVSDECLDSTKNFIKKEYGDNYSLNKHRNFKNKVRNAQEAHEAIRPTNIKLIPEKIKNQLSIDEFKLYSLIWNRMVASQMAEAKFDNTNIFIDGTNDNKSCTIKASGRVMVFDGFLKVYSDIEAVKKTTQTYVDEEKGSNEKAQTEEKDEDEEDITQQFLPNIEENDKISLTDVIPKQKFTKPPARYTEAKLIKTLEDYGIGRPSTYPNIIDVLQKRKYVKLLKRKFCPESRGELVNALLTSFFDNYISYNFTADIENELDSISNGEIKYIDMMKKFWNSFNCAVDDVLKIKNFDILREIQKSLSYYIKYSYKEFKDIKYNDLGDIICPLCKVGEVVLNNTVKGAFLGCSKYPECNYIRNFDNIVSGQVDDGTNEFASTNSDQALENINENNVFDVHSKTKNDIVMNKGRFGYYLETIDEFGEKKRCSISPKNIVNGKCNISLEKAEFLLSLPKKIGLYEDGKEMFFGIGQYGPYVMHNKKYYSIKKLSADEAYNITQSEAIELINLKLKNKK